MIELYDYQQAAYAAIKDAFKVQKEVLAVMATGLGKTYVAAFWSKNEIKKGKKGLLLCHNTHILEQSIGDFREVHGKQAILKTFFGGSKDWNADQADIVFATFQTLRKSCPFFEDEFSFIIVDESHHGKAPTYCDVLSYFSPKKLLGITATPDRTDEQDIREIFGEPVVNIALEEAIAKGWLSPIEYHLVTDGLSHWKLKRLAKEFVGRGQKLSVKQLNETLFIDARDDEIAKIILDHAGKDKKTIVFCERMRHADNFSNFLPNSGVCHSGHPKKKNRQVLDAFRKGKTQFLVAINQVNEGVDIPDAEIIVFLRCTDSKTIFLQQLGRGLRKMAGKEKVVVLDFVGNCDRILTVKEIVSRVKLLANGNNQLSQEVLKISGKGFDFIFGDGLIEILEILKKIAPKYISDIPELLDEYSNKNELPPDQVRAGTNAYIWWICSKCGAEFQMRGNNRLMGRGCKLCNRITITHPELTKEYSSKNPIPADKITKGSNRRVLWECGICGHEWEKAVRERLRLVNLMNDCPNCPKLAKEMEKKHMIEEERREFAKTLKKEQERARKMEKEEEQEKVICYKNQEDAVRAAISLGINNIPKYNARRRRDPKLPRKPKSFYGIKDGETFWTKLEEACKKKIK